MIDQLESRVLLSTGGTPDPGFGQGGYLKGYQVLAVEKDGSLIARQDTSSGTNLVQLHPDGSFEANYTGAAPTPPKTNVQSDGKYLVINGQSLTTGNTLTRYNADGTVDTSFGNNGTVSDFTSGTGYPAGAFNPDNVTVDSGGAILVSGPLNLGGEGHDSVTALVHVFYNGSIDQSFGTNGIAQGTDVSDINDVRTYQTLAGPSGNYFVSGEFDGKPLLTEFSSGGAYINSAHLVNSGEDHVYSVGFSAKNVYMLADWTSTEEALAAYDLNLKPDTGFGTNGLVAVLPPDHSTSDMPDGFTPGPMFVDPDGRVFVSSLINYQDGTGGDYAITYLPDWGANTSVSGFIYNDVNANGQRDSGDTPMRYWQAFVDLNGNGTYDAGEPTAYADYNGYYKIHALDPGTYKVYEVGQPQFTLTQPPSVPYHTFTVSSGQVSTGNDFGNAHLNTFDDNGGTIAGYLAQQVLPNGVIVAKDSSGNLVGLNPDGTIDTAFNPATDVPPTPLPGVYQPDGKRLVLNTTNSTITRYNADGSVDRTFGTNGTFSGFAQTPTRYVGTTEFGFEPYQGTAFVPKTIALQGGNIIVLGDMSGTFSSGNQFSDRIAVERITSNGLQDNGFGVVVCQTTYNNPIINWSGLFVANGGQIDIVTSDDEEYSWGIQLSSDGTTGNVKQLRVDLVVASAQFPDGSFVIEGWVDGGYPPGMQFVDQYSADFSLLDETWIGPGSIPNFDPLSDWFGAGGSLLIGADRNIFVSLVYMHNNQPDGNYLLRLPSVVPDGSGSISGYIYNDANGNGVIDSGEQPLRYAQAFVDLNGNGKFDLGEPTAYADYNGLYKIDGVAPGTYQVYEVPQTGYTQDAPSATPYRTVSVTAGSTTTGVDFGNRPTQPGSISGTFFYDSNTNGAWDSGEAPSPYWGVYIDANNDGKYDTGDTELIANGAVQFTFNNLAPGTYIVRGTTASGWTQTFPANGGGQSVTVGSGQAVTGINIGEFHGTVSTAKGSISGTFFYDSNTNGTWDSGEAPSPYWGVYIDANNDGTYDSGDTELIANGAGQYTFSNLAPGTYIVRGTTASGWTQTFPANGGGQTVTVGSGQAVTGINIGEFHGTVPTANGSISGTFFYDSNHNGVWDSGEPISPYWGVYIDANNDGKYDSGDTELIANGNGQFTFPNLPAGTYVIRGTTASGWTQTSPANGGAQVVTLATGQNLSNINFGEYHGIVSSGATGSISGTFFYDSNANGIWDSGETYSPSWGVYIDANNDGVYDSGDTELIATAHGQYTFSNLSAGTYVIRATTASGWKQTYPANGGAQIITLASGQNATGVNFGKVRT